MPWKECCKLHHHHIRVEKGEWLLLGHSDAHLCCSSFGGDANIVLTDWDLLTSFLIISSQFFWLRASFHAIRECIKTTLTKVADDDDDDEEEKEGEDDCLLWCCFLMLQCFTLEMMGMPLDTGSHRHDDYPSLMYHQLLQRDHKKNSLGGKRSSLSSWEPFILSSASTKECRGILDTLVPEKKRNDYDDHLMRRRNA